MTAAVALTAAVVLSLMGGGASQVPLQAQAQTADPLPSWNEGAPKKAIVDFVRATTLQGGPQLVAPEDRIAVFDQDGTLWVEHPLYTQVLYCLDRVRAVVKAKPELREQEPFKTVLSGDRAALAKLTEKDIEAIAVATLTGMTVEQFQADVAQWLASAKDARWHKPYTQLTYQPMQELLAFMRANGFKTYIVTGGGQDFVRVYASATYGVPPEQVIGTAAATKFAYDSAGEPVLLKEPTLMLNDNGPGKPEGIHLVIGKRPVAACGNSTGDQQMLEYTGARLPNSNAAHLCMLVLHDDAVREYAYGPAEGLPHTKVGTFSAALLNEARTRGWIVISMKQDWKRVFAGE